MMSECGSFVPDEAAVLDATIDDLDADTIKLYLMSRFAPVFKGKNIDELNMKDYSLDAMAETIIKGQPSKNCSEICVSSVRMAK